MYVWNGFLAWSNVCQQTKFFRDDVGVALGKNVDAGGDSRLGLGFFLDGFIYFYLHDDITPCLERSRTCCRCRRFF